MLTLKFSRRLLKVTFLALVALVAFAQGGDCQAAITYNSSYRAVNGRFISASVAIDGNNGNFQTFDQFGNPAGTGQLVNVVAGSFGGRPTLSGEWIFEGTVRGRFFWVFNDDLLSFRGNWTAPGRSGSWSGSYGFGSGQLGENGPSVP